MTVLIGCFSHNCRIALAGTRGEFPGRISGFPAERRIAHGPVADLNIGF
jgi:hypothetical protein